MDKCTPVSPVRCAQESKAAGGASNGSTASTAADERHLAIYRELEALFTGEVGAAPYFDEPVTHIEHALQAASLATKFLAESKDAKTLNRAIRDSDGASESKSGASDILASTVRTLLSAAEKKQQGPLIPNEDLVLAALFHGALRIFHHAFPCARCLLADIGHICAPEDAPHMNTDGGPDVVSSPVRYTALLIAPCALSGRCEPREDWRGLLARARVL